MTTEGIACKEEGRKTMNSLTRCMCVINHEIPDRVPVIAQDAQVAAYLAGLNCIEYATDADKRASAIIAQRERFDYDGAIIGGDTVCLAEAVGVEVQYSETQGPRWKAGCLENYDSIDELKLPDPTKDGRLPVLVEVTWVGFPPSNSSRFQINVEFLG